jgi:WD40 repeat protein
MLTAGTRLGPYEILAKAGAGGMGEVYRALDERLDRVVAVKLLPAHLADREDLRHRFQTEARAIARLQHANICAVFDCGEEGGVDYLVLEYLEGETLEKQLERGPLPVSTVLRIGAQMAAGLDAAHRAGITHRDLKPANVMLTKSGAKLLDFGLAKITQSTLAAAGGADAATVTKALTVEGAILGTFQYMAPEQLEGGDAGARTDIFALGLVLYEMVAGRKAFQGKSQATLIAGIMSSEPEPVTAIQPAAPPALERAIQRCLAKDPDERWQTARDLCRELEWIALGGSQPTAAPAAKRRGPSLAWAMAAASLLVSVVFACLYIFQRPAATYPVARFSVLVPPDLSFQFGPLIAPDGASALIWLRDGPIWRAYLYNLATGEMRALPNSEALGDGCWAPDSRSFLQRPTSGGGGGDLRKYDLATGAVTSVARTTAWAGTAWSRRGVILYDDGSGVLYRIPAGGGTPQQVLALKGERTSGIQFLPDDDHFLITVASGAGEIRAGSLSGAALKVVLRGSTSVSYAAPGWLLFVRDGSLLAQRFDTGSLSLAGVPLPVISGVFVNLDYYFTSSDTGVLMFHRSAAPARQQLTWIDRAGRKTGTVADGDPFSNPALSPDGKQLAVGVGDVSARLRDIWVYDLVRGGRRRVTLDPADDYNPTWSPDGRYIAFSSNRRGRRDIYRKLASGIGEDELLYATTGNDKNVESWSPDGRFLWFNFVDPITRNDIYQFSFEDRKIIKRISSPFAEDQAQLSPDGRMLAYHSTESGRDEIYLQPYPETGERWPVSTAGGNEPQWAGDGKELYFLSRDALMAVDIKSSAKGVEIGIPHMLFEAVPTNRNVRNNYVPLRDGQKFLFITAPERHQRVAFDTIVNWPELIRGK